MSEVVQAEISDQDKGFQTTLPTEEAEIDFEIKEI
jgi:hypothetical protein